jgi:hydrogenase/urease accessory protein HupE
VRFTHLAAVALLIQLVFGALGRHLPNGAHAVWTHAGFSIVVVLLTVMSSAIAADRDARPRRRAALMRRVGLALTVGRLLPSSCWGS